MPATPRRAADRSPAPPATASRGAGTAASHPITPAAPRPSAAPRPGPSCSTPPPPAWPRSATPGPRPPTSAAGPACPAAPCSTTSRPRRCSWRRPASTSSSVGSTSSAPPWPPCPTSTIASTRPSTCSGRCSRATPFAAWFELIVAGRTDPDLQPHVALVAGRLDRDRPGDVERAVRPAAPTPIAGVVAVSSPPCPIFMFAVLDGLALARMTGMPTAARRRRARPGPRQGRGRHRSGPCCRSDRSLPDPTPTARPHRSPRPEDRHDHHRSEPRPRRSSPTVRRRPARQADATFDRLVGPPQPPVGRQALRRLRRHRLGRSGLRHRSRRPALGARPTDDGARRHAVVPQPSPPPSAPASACTASPAP